MRGEALAALPQLAHLHARGDGWIRRKTVILAARLLLASKPLQVGCQSDRLVPVSLIGKFQRRYNNNHASFVKDTYDELLHSNVGGSASLAG